MEDLLDVGGRDGGRNRTKEVTLLRIDHSDVYLENERLSENLVHTIDSIHKSRYRKAMVHDSEINQLKKSLQAVQKHTTSLESSHNRFGGGKEGLRPNSKEKVKGKNQDRVDGIEKGLTSQKQRTGRPLSTPTTLKSIEVRMPQARMVSIGHDGSGDSDDGDDDDDDDDISSLDSSDDDDICNDSNRNMHRLNHTVTDSKQHDINSNNNNNKNTIRRLDSKSNPMNSTPSAHNKHQRGASTEKKAALSQLMSHLNLEKVPPSWYTSVVPATDVHVYKRDKRRNQKNTTTNGKEGSRRRKGRLPRSKTSKSVRPKTSGDIFQTDSLSQQNQQRQRLQQRPFTSIGMHRGGGGGERRREATGGEGGIRVNNNAELDGTASSLLCTQHYTASKTLRQLKEEEEIQASLIRTYSNVEILLEGAKEERKAIDQRVKHFVQSLDELKRSERLRNMLVQTAKGNVPDATW